MPAPSQFQLGPFTVDGDGRLAPREAGVPPTFSFRWREHTIHASMTAAGEDSGQLDFRTRLGRIPSTAEADPAQRPRGFSAIRELGRELPESWRVRLLPDHRAMLDVQVEIELPITATALVTECTLFLLTLAPYLEVLEGTGLTATRATVPNPAR